MEGATSRLSGRNEAQDWDQLDHTALAHTVLGGKESRIGYLLVTGARLGWSLDGSISLITSPGVFLFLSWSASSHVEKYDKALHQGPESE